MGLLTSFPLIKTYWSCPFIFTYNFSSIPLEESILYFFFTFIFLHLFQYQQCIKFKFYKAIISSNTFYRKVSCAKILLSCTCIPLSFPGEKKPVNICSCTLLDNKTGSCTMVCTLNRKRQEEILFPFPLFVQFFQFVCSTYKSSYAIYGNFACQIIVF